MAHHRLIERAIAEGIAAKRALEKGLAQAPKDIVSGGRQLLSEAKAAGATIQRRFQRLKQAVKP